MLFRKRNRWVRRSSRSELIGAFMISGSGPKLRCPAEQVQLSLVAGRQEVNQHLVVWVRQQGGSRFGDSRIDDREASVHGSDCLGTQLSPLCIDRLLELIDRSIELTFCLPEPDWQQRSRHHGSGLDGDLPGAAGGKTIRPVA